MKYDKHGFNFHDPVTCPKLPGLTGRVIGFHPAECNWHKPIIVKWDNPPPGEQIHIWFNPDELVKVETL